MIDAQAFGAELAGIVKAATAPLLARIAELEAAVSAIPEVRHGKDADPAEVAALVREQIMGELVLPEPGLTEEQLAEQMEAMEGRIIDRAEKAVGEAMGALPAPEKGEDGSSVTVDDVAPLVAAEVAKAVAAIPPAKDGVGLADALIGRDGELVVTLTNGETKNLGSVVGKDGDPGADGVGFDDLSVEYDGERSISLVFLKDGTERAFTFDLPMMLDRGVFVDRKDYAAGDTVSYGGSIWIAQKFGPEGKPGMSSDWRLAVKKGRNAKEA